MGISLVGMPGIIPLPAMGRELGSEAITPVLRLPHPQPPIPQLNSPQRHCHWHIHGPYGWKHTPQQAHCECPANTDD